MSWISTATIFLNSIEVGFSPNNIFVDGLNRVYVALQNSNLIKTWDFDASLLNTKSAIGVRKHDSIFVSYDGYLYVSTDNNGGSVERWRSNETTSTVVLNSNGTCRGLFIVKSTIIYCSLWPNHIVVSGVLNSNGVVLVRVAGNGINGSLAHQLNHPQGVFVDENSNLYIADSYNHRIQCFAQGSINGTTVAGNSSSSSMIISLNFPSSIVLDGNGYLFIADSGNNRILALTKTGFICVFGCSMVGGSNLYQLHNPQALNFDSYGNLFIADTSNNRIVKLTFNQTSCSALFICFPR